MTSRIITLYLSLLCLTTIAHLSHATLKSQKPTLKPLGIVLPIRQDPATKLLVADIFGRTPQVDVSYIVDLTALHVWANCETNYKSVTFTQPKCGSPQCKEANTSYCFNYCSKATRPFCHNNTCGRLLENPVTHQSTIGEVSQDRFVFRSTNGFNPGRPVQIPNFLFTCAPSALTDLGLPRNVQGVAGLGHGPLSLQNNIASKLGLKPVFTMCIPPDPSKNGVIFFGSNGPYSFSGIDASKQLTYTKISTSYFGEYYINVKSIKINKNQIIPIKESLLSVKNIDTAGGTTFNTLLNYTILDGSIYKALISSYSKALPNVATVKPVPPFGLCYEANKFPPSRLGPVVPSIDMELEGTKEMWSIYGVNSMVEAKPGVLCLAFVNGGNYYRAAVNIGSYQMKNVVFEFDVGKMMLGIGYPLSGFRTGCNYFNFTIAG